MNPPRGSGAPRLNGSRGRLAWRLKRHVGRALAAFNRLLHPTPPGRWLHNRLSCAVEFSSTDVDLVRGGEDLDFLSIAFLSDLHAGHYMLAADLERLAERIAVLQPDLVCLGGDLVNTHWKEVLLLEGMLERLSPPLGVFAVPGNHEYYRPSYPERWADYLQSRGVQVLWNRGVRLEHRGSRLWLGGVDDRTEGRPDVGAALDGRAPGEPAVLLSHHPDMFSQSAEHDVDLQLSGHTHGGQINLFGWTPWAHSRFVAGLYRRGDAQLYVGRGAGVTTFPVRIGAPPEVAFVRLRVDAAASRERAAG